MFSSQTSPALLLLTTTVLTGLSAAAPPKQPPPHPQLEDLQCQCLTFSTAASPTPCSYQELLTLDWEAAFSLSLTNVFAIQFASQSTIDDLLAIPTPLPLSLLQSIHEGGGEVVPLDPSGKVQSENRMVCGFGDEVREVGRRGRSRGRGVDAVEVHYVGTVLGLFMLLLVGYLVGEWSWNRFTSRAGKIKLEGDEKALMAECEAQTTNLSLEYP